jgi:hypothetical protein
MMWLFLIMLQYVWSLPTDWNRSPLTMREPLRGFYGAIRPHDFGLCLDK